MPQYIKFYSNTNVLHTFKVKGVKDAKAAVKRFEKRMGVRSAWYTEIRNGEVTINIRIK